MPRFAANLSTLFGEVPFLDRFAAAARAGFEAVEFLFPYPYPAERLAELLERHRLRQVLFNLPPGDWEAGDRGLACHPDRRGEFQDGVGRAVAYATALGCGQLHCMAGVRPPGRSEVAVRDAYLANLSYAAGELARHGLTLLVEPINTRDMPGYHLETTGQALQAIAEVGAPNLRLQFDAYHVQVMEGDLANRLQAQLQRIGHVQVADNPGRHEPGTGEINYPFLFGHLDRLGYAGWIGCEYRPLGATEAGLGWIRPWLPAPRAGATGTPPASR